MARRNRRPRVIWLPPNDSANVGVGLTNGIHHFGITAVGNAGDHATGEVPLTIDGSFSAVNPDVSLADMYSSGYRLRRIVGKIWCWIKNDEGLAANAASLVLVTAGIIVRREDPTTGASMASAFGDRDTSPVEIENYSDPWIWRRSWILANNGNPGFAAIPKTFAESNWTNYAGGNADGPHVDQKTARVVGPEERLFLDITVMLLEAAAVGTEVVCYADLRCLASLITTSGNRRNASR